MFYFEGLYGTWPNVQCSQEKRPINKLKIDITDMSCLCNLSAANRFIVSTCTKLFIEFLYFRRWRRRSPSTNVALPSPSTSILLSIHCIGYVKRRLLPILLLVPLHRRQQRIPTLSLMNLFWEVRRPVRLVSHFIDLVDSHLFRQILAVISAMLLFLGRCQCLKIFIDEINALMSFLELMYVD